MAPALPPSHPFKPIPPSYGVGLVTKSEARDSEIVIRNPRFGYIICSPKPEDAASGRRRIDFDGKNIMVR